MTMPPRKHPARKPQARKEQAHKSASRSNVVPLRKPRKCPICGQPARHEWRPFCSRRCADIDLHRWLSGQYVISSPADESTSAADSHRDDED